MNDDDPVDARFRALEARIASLEATARAASPATSTGLAAHGPAQQARLGIPSSAVPAARVLSVRAAPTAPTAVPSAKGPSWTAVLTDLEEKLNGRALAVVGGVALVAGAIFFLSLAFSRGWIGPEGRVLNHGISRRPGSHPAFHRRGFIDRYVFPDGELHEIGTVVSRMQRSEFSSIRLIRLTRFSSPGYRCRTSSRNRRLIS